MDFINYADLFAIIAFSSMIYYFMNKDIKTPHEKFLYAFAITGLIVDIIFTLQYMAF